ncbi:MAG: HEAT repeat domain-containing protein, partial [Planctomycetota bacterium]
MLTPEAAKEALKKFKLKGWAKRRLAAIDKLPAAQREAARLIAGIDRRGRRLDWLARHDSNRQEKALSQIESLPSGKRLRVFKALFPGLAQHVNAAWDLTKRLPYQTGYMRRAFRAPNTPSLTANRRSGWLTGLAETVEDYEPDAVWLATWGGHIEDYSAPMAVGVLLAAAIDEGGKVGEEVRGILKASANGEHEIGRMGSHIVRAFLACSQPHCWEFMEKMLLAAQRQEGLRQSILEAVDESHPEAFRRMLRVILENDLARFSSVVRAFDVWFGFLEGATNARVVNDNIARILRFFDDPKARTAAMRNGGGDDVYVALWTLGFEDAVAAVKPAAKLLKDKDVERRGAAVYFLRQANLAKGYLELVGMVEDEDPGIAACAVETFTGWMGLHESICESDLFERLERLAERVPDKGKEQGPLIWPWHTHTLDRRLVSLALHRARGKRSPARLAPYVKMMEPGVRGLVAQDLVGMKRLPADARKTLFALAGDASPSVREHALKAISKLKASPEEMRGIEALLTRKAADLRRGVLSILLNQKDPGALASADRLLGAKTAPERVAGLEVLRQMVEADRSREECRGRARKYREARPKVADA